jgi:hypothetical protein
MTEKVTQDDIQKGLAVLQDLAKGHASKGTPSTESTSMVGQSGPTQIHHTPSNSDPGSWAGSSASAVPQNGTTDAIDANGTDYTQAKMMKSIMDKIAKGQALNEFEAYFMKSVMDKALPPAFDKKKDEKEDVEKGAPPFGKKDDEDKDVAKSLADYAGENETVEKGLEVSEFLANWADVMHKSQSAMENRIVSRILGALSGQAEASAEFQKSLAGAVHSLGQGVALQAQRLAQVESTPARGPKSAPRVDVIEKSQGGAAPAGADALEGFEKSLVGDALVELVTKGQVAPKEVVAWESSNGNPRVLTPATKAKVAAHIGR